MAAGALGEVMALLFMADSCLFVWPAAGRGGHGYR